MERNFRIKERIIQRKNISEKLEETKRKLPNRCLQTQHIAQRNKTKNQREKYYFDYFCGFLRECRCF